MEKLYGDEREFLDLVVRQKKSVGELNSFYLEKYKPDSDNDMDFAFIWMA